jgi:hypothetical protein
MYRGSSSTSNTAKRSPISTTPEAILAEIDALPESIRERNGGQPLLRLGETWRDLVDEGRRM